MRTTLDLDDTLMEALLSRIPGATKTEAIEQALRAVLRDEAVAGLRAMAGSVEIVDVSGEMRR